MAEIQDDWKFISSFYPSDKAQALADLPIVRLVVNGFSNKDITNRFNLYAGEIEDISKRYLEFGGWKGDLGFSPLHYYYIAGGDFDKYKKSILTFLLYDDIILTDMVKMSFEIVKRYIDYRKGLEYD